MLAHRRERSLVVVANRQAIPAERDLGIVRAGQMISLVEGAHLREVELGGQAVEEVLPFLRAPGPRTEPLRIELARDELLTLLVEFDEADGLWQRRLGRNARLMQPCVHLIEPELTPMSVE